MVAKTGSAYTSSVLVSSVVTMLMESESLPLQNWLPHQECPMPTPFTWL